MALGNLCHDVESIQSKVNGNTSVTLTQCIIHLCLLYTGDEYEKNSDFVFTSTYQKQTLLYELTKISGEVVAKKYQHKDQRTVYGRKASYVEPE